MTTNNAQKFLQQVYKDNNLRKKVSELYRTNPKKIPELAVQMGYPCTYEELKKAFSQEGMYGKELANHELEEIVAGKVDPDKHRH